MVAKKFRSCVMKYVSTHSLKLLTLVFTFSLFFCVWLGLLQQIPNYSFKDNRADVDVPLDAGFQMEIVEALSLKLFDSSVKMPRSHPLETKCKYPVLQPEDPNIESYIYHKTRLKCDNVLPNLVGLAYGTVYVNDKMARKLFNESIQCKYRPISGALIPHVMSVAYIDDWKIIPDFKLAINHEQFVVKCYRKSMANNTDNSTAPVYRNAFAQVTPKLNLRRSPNFKKTDENTLSLDIIGLDSTSFNQFRRHMPKTWKFMKEVLGTFHFEGFNKVADNSIVNWIPTFTGMRFGNMSKDMLSEFKYTGKPLELEEINFIWKQFSRKGCITMMNDDPMHFSRGLFHYPQVYTKGFRIKPTDYFFRPWHVQQRRHPFSPNASNLCFNNEPYYQLQLELTKQMIKRYKDTCHFSFSFLTDVTHDDPNLLELLDAPFHSFLTDYYKNGNLNKTALIIMGDHGNRISPIQFTYVGRIEERASFFSLTLPKWFRDKHPKLETNLEINKHRLASNYDVYRTIKDILDENFDVTSPEPKEKGISLFREIPSTRTCREAQVPENHCLCMVPSKWTSNIDMHEWSARVITEYTFNRLKLYPKCQSLLKIEILNLEWLTTNVQVKYGVREWLEVPIQKRPDNSIEYADIEYRLVPTSVQATIRLQYDKTLRSLIVNVESLPQRSTVAVCSSFSDIASFCACFSFKNDVLT